MFGGVSTDIDGDSQRPRHDEGAEWIVAAPDGFYGWSNEYFEFDLGTSMWMFLLNEIPGRAGLKALNL